MSFKEHPITKQMQQIAPDVVCIWNEVIERWQVYQMQEGAMLLPNGRKNKQTVLMWSIETANGSYRDPGSNDLTFLIQTVENSKKLWAGNADQIADKMDAETDRREGAIGEQTGEILRALAKETGHLAHTTNRIKNARAYADAAAADILKGARI